MPERLSQIDVLIHPGFSLFYKSGRLPISEGYRKIMRLWDERVIEIAKNPQAVLLYFSPSLVRPSADSDLLMQSAGFGSYDNRHINKYYELLKERFFYFAGTDMPRRSSLLALFSIAGFALKPDSTHLTVYGEYFEYCVQRWGHFLQDELMITDSFCEFPQHLSLTVTQHREMQNAEYSSRVSEWSRWLPDLRNIRSLIP